MPNILKMPESIEGNIGNVIRRNHDYDNQMFNVIDKNRGYLREYLFWVDETKTIEDVKSSTEKFIENWNNGENFAYIITDKKTTLLVCLIFTI